MKSHIVPSRRPNFGAILTESCALFALHCEMLSFRVSDWTNEVFSHSFAFLIDGLCISYEFYAGIFSCVNLNMYEIKV